MHKILIVALAILLGSFSGGVAFTAGVSHALRNHHIKTLCFETEIKVQQSKE